MKKLNVLILFLGISSLGLFATGCASNKYFPNHIGISPSMEWEIQEDYYRDNHYNVKYKPRIASNIDWNF